jgi:signal transduction histidine kinase
VEADRDAALHAVSAAVLAVTRHLSVHEVFQVIVRAAAQLLDARYAALGVPDDAGSFAEFVVEGVSDEQWKAIGPLPRQHGLLAVMLREDKVQRFADVHRAAAFEGWPSAHPVLRDFLGVPIRDGDETLGIIFVANKRTGGEGFTAGDEERLTLFAAHAAIAMTNARLYERNRELTVIEERSRLARELHDAVAQKLFSLRLTAAAALAAKDPRPELERVQALAGEAFAELRSVIFELRPAELEGDGLAESLRKHVQVLDRVWGAGRGRRTSVRFEGEEIVLPPETEAVVFRVAQEALYNALRHGDPRAVIVRLTPGLLEIRDDGTGFDARAGSRDGLGLASMRERAASVGATLRIDSSSEGTVVRLLIPGGGPPDPQGFAQKTG